MGTQTTKIMGARAENDRVVRGVSPRRHSPSEGHYFEGKIEGGRGFGRCLKCTQKLRNVAVCEGFGALF